MFCDLVGSTALSEKLDPEELRSLLHAYRTRCGDVIARSEGRFPNVNRSALIEQLRRALDLVAALSATPAFANPQSTSSLQTS